MIGLNARSLESKIWFQQREEGSSCRNFEDLDSADPDSAGLKCIASLKVSNAIVICDIESISKTCKSVARLVDIEFDAVKLVACCQGTSGRRLDS